MSVSGEFIWYIDGSTTPFIGLNDDLVASEHMLRHNISESAKSSGPSMVHYPKGTYVPITYERAVQLLKSSPTNKEMSDASVLAGLTVFQPSVTKKGAEAFLIIIQAMAVMNLTDELDKPEKFPKTMIFCPKDGHIIAPDELGRPFNPTASGSQQAALVCHEGASLRWGLTYLQIISNTVHMHSDEEVD